MMKLLTTTILLLCLLNLSAQRGEVPSTNPDNALHLKTVFQEYTVTTTSYQNGMPSHYSKKGKFLILKVNDMYLPDDDTGIYKDSFKSYLSNCPKALDLGLDGLSAYDNSDKFRKIKVWGGSLLGLGALGMSAKYSKSNSEIDRSVGIGLLASAIGTAVVFHFKMKNAENEGDDKIVEAFDSYDKLCYKPELNARFTEKTNDENTAITNGESNKDEVVMVDVLSNNVKSLLWTIGPSIGFKVIENYAYSYGADLSIYKKGFYLNAQGHRHGFPSLSSDSGEDQKKEYSASIVGSVPLFRKKSKAGAALSLGQAHGFEVMGIIEDAYVYSAFAIDVGLDYSQAGSYDNFEVHDYFVTSTFARAGISLSGFQQLSFSPDDNRFSDKTKHSMLFYRFYLNGLYDYQSDYEILRTTFLSTAPTPADQIGMVLGLDVRVSKKSKHGAITAKLEGGKYPISNQQNGWGGKFTMGYSLYSGK